MYYSKTKWNKGDFYLTTDKEFLDHKMIIDFLHNDSYWANERSKEDIIKSINHSAICFGIFKGEPSISSSKQVGFARVISDFTTFSYLADVFVVKDFRGIGLSKWLLEAITEHPSLSQVPRFMLATKDAHRLYSKFGFKKLETPNKWMERLQY